MMHAILATPLYRRRQTLAVAAWFYFPLFSIILLAALLRYIRLTWPVLALYCTWYACTLSAPFSGAALYDRLGLLAERLPIFTHFSPYFPVSVEFDGSERAFVDSHQYMFGYHPHGIFGLGAVAAFAMNRPAGLAKLRLRLLTVDANFYIPFWRELLMFLGLAGVGRGSVRALLATGHSLAIVIGGAREALDAAPGMVDLVLKRRKGFFREALMHGAAVVPVFGFGENELYDQVRWSGSRLRALQDRLIHFFGFTLPVFNGRGMFNYHRGVLPRRHPLHVVIGQPIRVAKRDNPSAKEIDHLQASYVDELQRLYDKYKNRYHKDRRRSLTIIQ